MNAKTLFICLTILAVLSCSAQCLMMINHKASVFAHETVQKVANFHRSSAGPDIPDDVVKDLAKFMQGDKQIMEDINKGKYSKQSANKIQGFFLRNKSFVNGMVNSLDKDPDMPQCYKNLTLRQKQKFVLILIHSMDFGKILNGEDTQLSNDDLAQIKKTINNDKDLGPSVLKCLNGHIEI